MLAAVRQTSRNLGMQLHRHVAAIGVFALWAAVTVKTFWFTGASDVQAQAASYGAFSTWAALLFAALLGLRALQGSQP